MKYDVVLQGHARRDIWETHAWIAKRAPVAADTWLNRLQAKIKTLEERPDRCPVITERARLSFDVRELLYGRKPHIFRIIFVIDGSRVRVLRVRRGQRRQLTSEELDRALQDDELPGEE
ncbi:MAG: type II toxin-antitoxin system RelE/ParE family toxin [Pirellulaceae bacterium]